MFKLECFIDDKHLALVLHALSGKALNLKTTPVTNAVAGPNGDVQPVTRGDTLDMFKRWLADKDLKVIGAAHVKQFQMDNGRSPVAHGYVVKKALEKKIIKRSKMPKGTPNSRMTYDVINTTPDADT